MSFLGERATLPNPDLSDNLVNDPAAAYDLQDWRKGYRSLTQEYDYWIDEIEGEIPLELSGTLFRNGPGLLDVKGQPFHHPFDGDGMICAFSFGEGRGAFPQSVCADTGVFGRGAGGQNSLPGRIWHL